ncbi:four-carbon acid sugar kinase family protein [Jiella sonneratiae]|uniref:Four-carbon acid sugar kinase family protein n=1 Tax=Jiella sonneratiae TaxID=2816856 RepID=A0ABS3J8R3_9HYPH|nr:four-carbon acid sugar kinase family protein [Jiella sonneratiae]
MSEVLIIADDLTGALDSSVVFAERGLRTVVARRPADLAEALAAGAEVVAVNTGSREVPAETALALLDQVFEAAAAAKIPILFKKVDSRLKGHAAAETGRLARLSGRGTVVVAPALPSLGRVVRAGSLTGRGLPVPVDVAALFDGLPATIVVPDTACETDFAALTAWCTPETLFAGARSLAAALASHVAHSLLSPADGRVTRPPTLRLPMVMAVGSRDPITLEQLDRLTGRGDMAEIEAPDGRLPAEGWGDSALTLARMTQGGGGVDAAAAGAEFACRVCALVEARRPATLLACGGETADALLGRLGIGVLFPCGEAETGVPVSTVRLPGGRTLTLVTKSGGFGDPGTLLRLVEALQPVDKSSEDRLREDKGHG